MKKLFILLAVIATIGCKAETNQDKKFRKIAERVELPGAVRNLSPSDAGDFWQLLVDNDLQLKKFDHDIAKRKGAEKEAEEKYASMPRFYARYNTYVDTALQPYADSLLATVGSPASTPAEGLYFISDYYPAAYTVLTDSAYAVCITTGLLSKPGVSDDLLKAIIARQIAHGALRHQLRYFYDEAISKRRRRTVGGFAIGLTLVAATALAVTEPEAFDDPYGDIYIRNQVTIEGGAPQRMPAAIYSPDQEYAADLVGYRFMQSQGKGDLYVEALRLLAPEFTTASVPETGDPNISQRIDFIKYIASNPDILNKKSEGLRRKQ